MLINFGNYISNLNYTVYDSRRSRFLQIFAEQSIAVYKY